MFRNLGTNYATVDRPAVGAAAASASCSRATTWSTPRPPAWNTVESDVAHVHEGQARAAGPRSSRTSSSVRSRSSSDARRRRSTRRSPRSRSRSSRSSSWRPRSSRPTSRASRRWPPPTRSRSSRAAARPRRSRANGQDVQTVIPNPLDQCSQAQLTPAYLQFTYIQALKQLASSNEHHHAGPAVRQEPDAADHAALGLRAERRREQPERSLSSAERAEPVDGRGGGRRRGRPRRGSRGRARRPLGSARLWRTSPARGSTNCG